MRRGAAGVPQAGFRPHHQRHLEIAPSQGVYAPTKNAGEDDISIEIVHVAFPLCTTFQYSTHLPRGNDLLWSIRKSSDLRLAYLQINFSDGPALPAFQNRFFMARNF
jgi:hypothetical protein